MKKVLIGLVIAVMMTGSGYANLDQDHCFYLKNSAEGAIMQGKSSYEKYEDAWVNGDISAIEKNEQREMSYIKRAHYYAVTWSALCD